MKPNSINLYVILLLLAALIFSFLTIYSFGEEKERDFSVSGRSAVLYQPETGIFLYSKNANARLPMASTTKIMTALVALESCDFEEIVEIGEESVNIEGSSAYLKAGEKLTMEELLYALLLQSANDAATAIAYHVGGSIEVFSDLMNEKAKSFGLQNTHFTNPHGLDNEEHYTTARDLSIITAKALENESFKQIVSTYKKTFATDNRSRTYVNHNKMLRMYEGCIGVKTGFTTKSGRCLVSAAERDGLMFISVTLDAPNDWKDHKAMLDLGYQSLVKISLADPKEYCYKIPVINGEKDFITVKNPLGASVILENKEHAENCYLKLVKYAIAPINEGDILGEIIFTVDGKSEAKLSLVAEENVLVKKEKGILRRFLSLFN